LITGCSTGVGLALSVLLASSSTASYTVYATMRNLAKKENLEKAAGSHLNKNLFIKELDVCSDSGVEKIVNEIISKEGRIDILVNNAGAGLSGPIENLSTDLAKENFDTNFFGVYRLTRAVIPHQKKNNSGFIVNLSSVGGIAGVPFNEVYCAAKFAVEGFSESLAPWARSFNIKVSLVEPGPILTDFVANAIAGSPKDAGNDPNLDQKTKDIFNTYRTRMMAGFKPETAESGSQVAQKIKDLLESPNPPFRLQTNTHPIYAEIPKSKFVDPTGSAAIDLAYKRFFA